jgi:hypothetical protein
MRVLSENPKVEKGKGIGVFTWILHLAPSWLSGFNVCSCASEGCARACLNASGRGGIPDGSGVLSVSGKVEGRLISWDVKLNNIQRARIARTRRFFEDRDAFMGDVISDIRTGIRQAERAGMLAAFRLNGTSDIRFESVPVTVDGVRYDNVFNAFPDVQFYDYTKLHNRRNIPANYHLTFSLSESNDVRAIEALANGLSVAVPFWIKKGEPMPETWGGFPVIDGDSTDVRFRDPRAVIVGLRAKGRPDAGNRFIRDPFGGFRSLPVINPNRSEILA